MIISNFSINTSSMPEARTVRPFVISGKIGAEFEIIALQNPSSSSDHTLYYDWKSKSFEAGHNDLNNNLRIKLNSGTYNNSLIFAQGASGGGDYVIKLITINGTTLSNPDKRIITKNVSKQASDTTVTLQLNSITYANNYQAQPSKTITSEIGSSTSLNFSLSAKNSIADAYSNGLILSKYASVAMTAGKILYHLASDTVDGATTSSTSVVVDDLTGIGIGSTIYSISSGTLTGEPSVTAIDTATKTITLNTAQSFSNDITLYFRARGFTAIFNATGLLINSTADMDISSVVEPSTTVRVAPSNSSTIDVGNTQGLAGGGVCAVTGVYIDSSGGDVLIETVNTPDPADASGNLDGDGRITVSANQTLRVGDVINIKGTYNTVALSGTINIGTVPSSNVNIYFDLDHILTAGTAT